jgi:hypothetical protein
MILSKLKAIVFVYAPFVKMSFSSVMSHPDRKAMIMKSLIIFLNYTFNVTKLINLARKFFLKNGFARELARIRARPCAQTYFLVILDIFISARR